MIRKANQWNYIFSLRQCVVAQPRSRCSCRSVCCDTAQDFVFSLVSTCCDLLVSLCCDIHLAFSLSVCALISCLIVLIIFVCGIVVFIKIKKIVV